MATSSFEDPYLQSILEKIANEEGFQQPKFSISVGSKPGDNYCGRIYRTVISEANNDKLLSLIFKVSPLSKARQEKSKSHVIFRTETNSYETVLPTLNKILNKYGVVQSDIFPGTARWYTSNLENDSCLVLVLEDKVKAGYCVAGHNKSLDDDHLRKIIKKLALLHASSIALRHHEPDTAEQLKALLTNEEFFRDFSDQPILQELKQSAVEGLKFLKEPYIKGNAELKKLENIVENYITEFMTSAMAPTDSLASVIHGDCHFNNILYKYTDGSLEDVCLIDFQGMRLGSPAIDLSYLFFVCATKGVRDASYNELIQFYHDEMSSNLRKMDLDPAKIIPMELLQAHLKKFGRYGVLISLAALHVVLTDSSENSVDLHSAEDDENFFVGRGKTSDPRKLEEISERLTGVVTDALRLGII